MKNCPVLLSCQILYNQASNLVFLLCWNSIGVHKQLSYQSTQTTTQQETLDQTETWDATIPIISERKKKIVLASLSEEFHTSPEDFARTIHSSLHLQWPLHRGCKSKLNYLPVLFQLFSPAAKQPWLKVWHRTERPNYFIQWASNPEIHSYSSYKQEQVDLKCHTQHFCFQNSTKSEVLVSQSESIPSSNTKIQTSQVLAAHSW